MTTSVEPTPTSTDRGTRLKTRALAVAVAAAANAVLWMIGRLLDVDFIVDDPDDDRAAEAIPLGFVVPFSVLPALLGWAFLAVLERFTTRAFVIWTVVALVVTAVSMMPIAHVEATGGTKTFLTLMHLAVAAVLIPMFGRHARRATT